jgi:(2Fe-2S) ferredoxin
VQAVECLAVCKRPCTLAFAADGKWTYLIGDLDAEDHLDDIVSAAESYCRQRQRHHSLERTTRLLPQGRGRARAAAAYACARARIDIMNALPWPKCPAPSSPASSAPERPPLFATC